MWWPCQSCDAESSPLTLPVSLRTTPSLSASQPVLRERSRWRVCDHWSSDSWGQSLLGSELRSLQIRIFTKTFTCNLRRAPEAHGEAVWRWKMLKFRRHQGEWSQGPFLGKDLSYPIGYFAYPMKAKIPLPSAKKTVQSRKNSDLGRR